MLKFGIRLVWGIPDKIMPLVNFPPGKARFRFRENRMAEVFIKNKLGIHHYMIRDEGSCWLPFKKLGENYRPEKIIRPISPVRPMAQV